MAEQPVVLEAKHISKNYGEGEVLSDVSLSLHKGEVIVVIGPSGCGKSTFLRCMNGLEQIQSGQILLDGEVITGGRTNWPRVRQKIGMVFQNYELFPHMSVLDNIILGPVKVQGRQKKEAIEEAEKLLDRVGLLDKKDAYPRQLSGGQKQRVAIARAMANDPAIILADEPTGALDSRTGRMVMDLFHQLNREQGKTIVLITHNRELAMETQRVLTMCDGVLSEEAASCV